MDMKLQLVANDIGAAQAELAAHEKETGHPDPDWPGWYARYMADEVAGKVTGNVTGEGEAGGA